MKRFLLILLLVILVSLAAAFLLVDRIVAAAIERGTTHAAGVETKLRSADASLLSGRLELEGLSIWNPPKFRDEAFLGVASVQATWQNGTLLSDTLEMDLLSLDGVQVNLERSGSGTNYGTILENLKRLSRKPEKKPAGEGRVLAIKRIEIKNVEAGVHLGGLPLPAGSANVSVPNIVIENFRSDGDTTELVAKLTRIVVQAVLEQVLSAGGGILPAEILSDLGQGLGGLKDAVEGGAKEVLEGLKGVLKDAGGILKQ